MSLSGILLYVSRAALFAGVCTICLWLFRRVTGRALPCRQEILFLLKWAYLAALLEIIALRGFHPGAQRHHIQYIPLRTFLAQVKEGAWPLIYHTLGNLVWFVPLGMMMHRGSLGRCLLYGLLVSLGLECCQWLLGTGLADVDDLWLNALGAGAGYGIALMYRKHIKMLHKGV